VKKIQRNTPSGQLALKRRRDICWRVYIRDAGRCQVCREGGHEVHEIVPRSAFSSRTMPECFQEKNMIVICRKCHAKAASYEARRELLLKLRSMHGYDYSMEPWRGYVG